ncbi:hydroxylase [Streptomyces sp. NBC_00124]|uniref:hydroxylase n=1 Tax=Streptomyces sp. NBC_00124 TaxID=2975662 RepID=UPI00225935B4|nr:hydroxylase [Streptomyces sp. NBC_00124]MCX5366742.1 hydroxylase [Streptomyces sp. NBC_00124]
MDGTQHVIAADYGSTAELTEAYRGADGVFVHLPVASEEDRLTYARNIVAAVRATRPARVVFSTSGAPIDPESGGAAAALVSGLTDSGVSHAVITPTFYLENLLVRYVIDTAVGAHFVKDVAFEQITPEQFRDSVAPLIGEGPSADVAGAYAAMGMLPDRSITPENSAQKLLGIIPRTTGQWLTDIGL